MNYYETRAKVTQFIREAIENNPEVTKEQLYLVIQTKFGFGKKFVDETVRMIKGD